MEGEEKGKKSVLSILIAIENITTTNENKKE